jgi:glycosyltransferase involved in cell wall biosynthesis
MPYDLQHLHLPALFPRAVRRRREVVYPALARSAAAVVAISRWGKEDLVRNLSLPEERVRWVHLAPAVESLPEPTAAELAAVRERFGLREPFAFYPAQTWPHKNHLRVLEALAGLRDASGIRVPAVFSGHQGDFFPTIERRVRELRLQDQVRFLGFVSPSEMVALYRLARLLVFPSLFEGFGMPVVEAFRTDLPVACSRSTSLPEVAGDAAALFDPLDPGSIGAAIADLWTSQPRRDELVRLGRARVADFSWTGAARRFRALYRHVGGRPLDEADRALLEAMR